MPKRFSRLSVSPKIKVYRNLFKKKKISCEIIIHIFLCLLEKIIKILLDIYKLKNIFLLKYFFRVFVAQFQIRLSKYNQVI
jgi:hypothetical protein